MIEFIPSHRVLGAAAAPEVAFLLHGILGSGRNWTSFATRWTRERPSWRVVLVDLRGHGGSMGAGPPHDVAACASDLHRLAETVGSPSVVVGHSFGGRVALTYAAESPRKLQHLWIVDAPPGPPPGSHEKVQSSFEIDFVVKAIESVSTPAATRESVVQQLMQFGLPEPVARWQATSLGGPPGQLRFQLDLETIRQLLESYFASDCWPIVERSSVRMSFVRGTRSDRISGTILEKLQSLEHEGHRELHALETSHWVQAEDPDGLWRLIDASLDSIEALGR